MQYIKLLCVLIGLVITFGCSRNQVSQDQYNFMVIIDKDFIKNKTEYEWWPKDEDSILKSTGTGSSSGSGSGSGSFGGLNIGGDGKGAVVALAVIVAVVIVAETADVTYHNIRGMDVSFQILGSGVSETHELDWGVNRFKISESALISLEKNTANLYIVSRGTRKINLMLPTEGMRIKRDVHILEFASSGNIIVDGDRVKLTNNSHN